jgi:hypothetical protein
MILARTSLVLLGAITLAGCFSLPPPPAATAPSNVGDPAPVFSLARTDPPGRVTLDELHQNGPVVLVFYRGDW